MGQAGTFTPVKLICGIIANQKTLFTSSESNLCKFFGKIDLKSDFFSFDYTDYYDKQMGPGLKRVFLSFLDLIPPGKPERYKNKNKSPRRKNKNKCGNEIPGS